MTVRVIALAALVAIATSCDGYGNGSRAFGITQPPEASTTKLGFTAQPVGQVAAGASFAVQVAVQNANGTTVTTATSAITISITSGTGASGAVLGGTRTVNAVSGIAVFNNLTIDRAGNGYTLTASATGVTSATSTAFTVNP